MRKAYDLLRKHFYNFQNNINISHIGILVNKYNCEYCGMSLIGQVVFISLLYYDKIDYLIIGNEDSSNFGNQDYK